MELKITCLKNVEQGVIEMKPDIIISILDPGLKYPCIISQNLRSHLVFRLWDEEDNQQNRTTIIRMLRTIQAAVEDASERRSKILIHCNAGASRSTAVTLYLFRLIYEDDELTPFQKLLKITNKPWPNRDIVQIADECQPSLPPLLPELDEYRHQYSKRIDHYRRLNRKRGIHRVPV